MKTTQIIEKLRAQGLKKGVTFYGVLYPTRGDVMVDDALWVNDNWPNLVWCKAKTAFGETMNVVVGDTNGDVLAKFTAPLPPKVKEEVTPSMALQIKKGDTIKMMDGVVGQIVKYPSNSAIVIQDNNDVCHTIDKKNIQQIISKS
jgi:preprotein translocase subunit YajC